MDCLFNFSKDGLKISLSLLNSFNKTKVAIFPMQTIVPALTLSPANFTRLNDIPFYFEVKGPVLQIILENHNIVQIC